MDYDRPIVLSIAGFDPSGGAGVLADIKTFEKHKCLGMSVITAQTIQTENTCLVIKWNELDFILAQLHPLLENYRIDYVKIGILPDFYFLESICKFLKSKNKHIRIIWDPVFVASSGMEFMEIKNLNNLEQVCSMLYLITPNDIEIKLISKNVEKIVFAKRLSKHVNILWKGGHRDDRKGEDVLFENEKISEIFSIGSESFYEKHGTGCILSAAIVANLALGNTLKGSCERSKRYLEKIAVNNQNRLAYHEK